MAFKYLKLPIYDNKDNIIFNIRFKVNSEILPILNNHGNWQAIYSSRIWFAKRNYGLKNYKSKTQSLHRFIWEFYNKKEVPSGYVIDHINRNTLDNRIENLRLATRNQNAQNSRPIRGSSSKYKGVGWDKNKIRWIAKIYYSVKDEKRYKYIGRFKTEKEAALAYDREAKKLFGDFAYLNFPEDKNA